MKLLPQNGAGISVHTTDYSIFRQRISIAVATKRKFEQIADPLPASAAALLCNFVCPGEEKRTKDRQPSAAGPSFLLTLHYSAHLKNEGKSVCHWQSGFPWCSSGDSNPGEACCLRQPLRASIRFAQKTLRVLVSGVRCCPKNEGKPVCHWQPGFPWCSSGDSNPGHPA